MYDGEKFYEDGTALFGKALDTARKLKALVERVMTTLIEIEEEIERPEVERALARNPERATVILGLMREFRKMLPSLREEASIKERTCIFERAESLLQAASVILDNAVEESTK